MANSDPVGSLMRGIDILKLIGDAENGLKICEIAVALNLKQPTCYNLVRTLVMCGFVEKRNNRLYLGQDLIQLTKKHSNSAFFAGVETELLALYQRLPRCTVVFAVPGPQGMLPNRCIFTPVPPGWYSLRSFPERRRRSGSTSVGRSLNSGRISGRAARNSMRIWTRSGGPRSQFPRSIRMFRSAFPRRSLTVADGWLPRSAPVCRSSRCAIPISVPFRKKCFSPHCGFPPLPAADPGIRSKQL